MHKASTDEEILNYVSKKLATAQLSQRRPSIAKRLPQQITRSSSRVTKNASRHGSPIISENPSSSTSTRKNASELAQLRTGARSSSVVPVPRTRASKYDRPYSWHSSASNAVAHHVMPSTNAPQWQSSSYDWPGDVYYHPSSVPLDWTEPAFVLQAMQPYSDPTSAQEPLGSAFASYFPWSQPATSTSISVHSAMVPHNLQSVYDFPTGEPFQHEPYTSSYHGLPQHVTHAQSLFDVQTRQDDTGSGEELVGLGLYNKLQEASPKQLCAALPTSFIPNGNYGSPDPSHKLEDAWQQPPEWQHNESTEGSEASASPLEGLAYTALGPGQPSSFQTPHDYQVDFSNNHFLFENDNAWFSSHLKQLPYNAIDQGGYQWLHSAGQPNFM